MTMAEAESKQDEHYSIDYTLPKKSWMDPGVEFRKGTYCYPAVQKHQKYLDLPNPRKTERAEGRVRTIKPDEQVTFHHRIEFFEGREELRTRENILRSHQGKEEIGQTGDFAFLM